MLSFTVHQVWISVTIPSTTTRNLWEIKNLVNLACARKKKWTFNPEVDKFHLPCIYSFMALWCWTKDFSSSLGSWVEIVLRWRWNMSSLRGQHALKWLYWQPAPTLTPVKALCRYFSLSASQKNPHALQKVARAHSLQNDIERVVIAPRAVAN